MGRLRAVKGNANFNQFSDWGQTAQSPPGAGVVPLRWVQLLWTEAVWVPLHWWSGAFPELGSAASSLPLLLLKNADQTGLILPGFVLQWGSPPFQDLCFTLKDFDISSF